MKILIDNGHGIDTLGKRSPDGVFREYKYTRELSKEIVKRLIELGYDAQLLVPEIEDICLKERVKRVNTICKEIGTNNVILISIHNNAAGNGDWMKARGWSCYTSEGQTESDIIATFLYTTAEECFPGHKIRKEWSDGDVDWEAGFYILRKTLCPAVLTENFFMDNKEDYEYLLSDEGREAIITCHVKGIIDYTNYKKF